MAAATSDGKSSARRNAWPIRETSSCRDLTCRLTALVRDPERPFMAAEHATKDRRGTLLWLRVRAAETDEAFRAVLTGRQRAEMRAHVPQVAADGKLRKPATVGLATRILAIPMKRTDTKVRDYVTREEIDAVLATLDRTQWCGRRDYALLLTMYNAGARVSEIAMLRRQHVTFGPTCYIQLHGKGRNERSIPLWPKTARILKEWFREIDARDDAMAFPMSVAPR